MNRGCEISKRYPFCMSCFSHCFLLLFLDPFHCHACECFAYMFACVLCACLVPTEVRRGPGSPAAGAVDSCEQLCGCWELNRGSRTSALNHCAIVEIHHPTNAAEARGCVMGWGDSTRHGREEEVAAGPTVPEVRCQRLMVMVFRALSPVYSAQSPALGTVPLSVVVSPPSSVYLL